MKLIILCGSYPITINNDCNDVNFLSIFCHQPESELNFTFNKSLSVACLNSWLLNLSSTHYQQLFGLPHQMLLFGFFLCYQLQNQVVHKCKFHTDKIFAKNTFNWDVLKSTINHLFVSSFPNLVYCISSKPYQPAFLSKKSEIFSSLKRDCIAARESENKQKTNYSHLLSSPNEQLFLVVFTLFCLMHLFHWNAVVCRVGLFTL